MTHSLQNQTPRTILPGTQQVWNRMLAEYPWENADLGRTAPRSNQLTNGGFEVWQRGPGPFTTPGSYTADGWQLLGAAGASVNRDTFSPAMHVLSVAGSSIGQKLEAFFQLRGMDLSAKVAVLNAVPNAVRINLAIDGTNNYSVYHSGSGGWEGLEVTASIPGVPTSVGLYIEFDAAADVNIDNCMLVVGGVPTDYAPLHPADETARCQRYYEVLGQGGAATLALGGDHATASLPAYLSLRYAQKAVTPSVTVGGTWTVNNCTPPAVGAAVGDSLQMSTSNTAPGGFQFFNSPAGCEVYVEANP